MAINIAVLCLINVELSCCSHIAIFMYLQFQFLYQSFNFMVIVHYNTVQYLTINVKF